MDSETTPQSRGWVSLTPELVRRIAALLHPFEVVASLRLVCCDTATALSDYNTLLLGMRHAS